MNSLYKIDEVNDLYVDAFLLDQTQLIFLSVWGRDTALQEFFARLTLPKSEQGLREIHLENLDSNQTHFVDIPDSEKMDKTTGRTQSKLFGQLSHVFIYDKLAVKPDALNNRALLFYQDTKPDIWEIVKEACHLPLLDHWKAVVLAEFQQQGWIQTLNGMGIHAIKIHFIQQEVESLLERRIKEGVLTLKEDQPAPVYDVQEDTVDDFWSDAAIIHQYTRAQAIADGFLIDVTERSKESGIKFPVALTRSVWDDCVEWTDEDSHAQVYQDNSADPMASGRLSDVVFMAYMAMKMLSDKPVGQYDNAALTKVTESLLRYKILRVPRDGQSQQAEETELKLQIGPGDNAEPVITIMQLGED